MHPTGFNFDLNRGWQRYRVSISAARRTKCLEWNASCVVQGFKASATPSLEFMSDFCCLQFVPRAKSGFASVWINRSWSLLHAEWLAWWESSSLLFFSSAPYLGGAWCQSVGTEEWLLGGSNAVIHPPAERLINAPPTQNHCRHLGSRCPFSIHTNGIESN